MPPRAVVLATVWLALAPPAIAQDYRGQERAVTRAELDEKAEPGRTTAEVRAALGRPAIAQCEGRIEIWAYRTDNGRVDLMFVGGVLKMTILGGLGGGGAKGACVE